MRYLMAIILVTVIAADAQAQGRNCAPRDVIVERLATGYGETRQSVGIAANNTLVEIFASEESGSWTILVTQLTGVSCLVASGQSFQKTNESLPLPGDPT